MNAQPAASPLTTVAIENPEVLRILRDTEEPLCAPADVARAADVPAKNIARTLTRLESDGLVTRILEAFVLTDLGRRALTAIDLAAGREPAAAHPPADLDPDNDVLLLAHDQIRANPLQPRRLDLARAPDRQALDQLKASIVAAGDVLQNLVVFPPDPEGVHVLSAGERRWRAVGELIAEGAWPAGRRLRAIQRENSPGQAAFIGLVENGQRADLNLLEEARAYADLVAETGWSARQAALSTGRDPKTVQQMLQVVRLGAADNIARYQDPADPYTWEDLRRSVQTPQEREADGAGGKQADIEDVMRSSPTRPKDPQPDQYSPVTVIMAGLPDDLEGRLQVARDALSEYDRAATAGDLIAATAAAKTYDAVVWAINGGTHFGCAVGEGGQPSAQKVVAEALAAPLGEIPMWGQAGTFLLEVNGVRTFVVADHGPNRFHLGGYAAFHAADQESPFFSSTGFHSSTNLPGPGTYARAVTRHIVFLMSRKGGGLGPIEEPYRERERPAQWADLPVLQVPVSWLAEDETPPSAPPHTPVTAPAPVGVPMIGGGMAHMPKVPNVPPQRKLTAHEILVLVELAHAAIAAYGPEAEGRWVKCGKYWLDLAAGELKALGLITFSHLMANGPHAGLLELGRERLDDLGYDALAITDDDVARARTAAGEAGADGYATPWLNTGGDGVAQAPPPQGEGDRAEGGGEGVARQPEADPARDARYDLAVSADEDLLDMLVDGLRAVMEPSRGDMDRWSTKSHLFSATRVIDALKAGRGYEAILHLAALVRLDEARMIDIEVALRQALSQAEGEAGPDVLLQLKVGDLVSIGGQASGYRLLSHGRDSGAYDTVTPGFEAQQVSLKIGKDVGKPRTVTLHAIQGFVKGRG